MFAVGTWLGVIYVQHCIVIAGSSDDDHTGEILGHLDQLDWCVVRSDHASTLMEIEIVGSFSI